ncbi:MAG: Hsp70 family protein [Planctomycetes bacterium]|nr:Hsp70 family protein [Planctomycetota bacterium]
MAKKKLKEAAAEAAEQEENPDAEYSRYVIGIDLGTTNCAVSYIDTHEDEDSRETKILEIPQIVDQGRALSLKTMPSFMYIPGKSDVGEGWANLPWDDTRNYAVGFFARQRGSERPGCLVASAKSWLCNHAVDRKGEILPWQSQEEITKVSPLVAATRYLQHLAEAWDYQMAQEDESLAIANQEVCLTIPASFDAVARELTAQAAAQAGLGEVTLLEEPQSAFYSFLSEEGEKWRSACSVGDRILVCDVGGGTTDFSLIEVKDEDGDLVLERVAVGSHLLMGGDNMDLMLAHRVSARLKDEGTQLDRWQFQALTYSCSRAKEVLLEDVSKKEEEITILGRGASIFGGIVTTALTRDDVGEVLIEGFFPKVGKDEFPVKKPRAGLATLGLEYASDPAVSRHLAQFLGRNEGARPTAILFNGGVMKAKPFRDRIVEIVRSWGDDVRTLESVDLDLAVSRGAAYFRFATRGKGVRIRAGVARTYYIGIESTLPAVPGFEPPLQALCIVPFGTEEGSTIELPQQSFGLCVGEQAVFRFLSSNERKDDSAGTLHDEAPQDLEELEPLETAMSWKGHEGEIVPVTLEAHVTNVGTLEIFCVAKNADQRWKLEFNVRTGAEEE